MENKERLLENEIELESIRKKLSKLQHSIRNKRFGLVWMDVPEAFEKTVETKIPTLMEVEEKAIINKNDNVPHILIEGDNYHALTCLNYTHKNRVDLIYIDPPYNTGSDGFKYKDKRILEKYPDGMEVPKDHPFRHSYWLSFMKKRLELAKELLSDTGVIVIHIDENEFSNLIHLMNDIFGMNNDLGTIVWNKKNPKGDPSGVSIMHEYVLCYAKNKDEFRKLKNILTREKPNAVAMLKKAKTLYSKIGKRQIPEDVKEVLKPFNYPKETLEDFIIQYNLELVNKEFQNWLKRQNFSNGEKAYKYIDENGDVYRGVSMAWPNKEKAPEEYFIPLLHPVTGKECPIPQRGWRNPVATMKELMQKNLILFGEDEHKQPERKYLLKDNITENTPSIYEYAGSDDKYFFDKHLSFPYAKPVDVAKYFIKSVHPSPKIVMDFFAGSGTTGHAVMELNESSDNYIQFILISNNEGNIMDNVCYPRIKDVTISKFDLKNSPSLKYYQTNFVGKHDILNINDEDRIDVAYHAGELLAISEGTMNLELKTEFYQFYTNGNQLTAIYFREEICELENFIEHVLVYNKPSTVIYIFSWSNDVGYDEFSRIKNVKIKPIPLPILEVYKEIYNLRSI